MVYGHPLRSIQHPFGRSTYVLVNQYTYSVYIYIHIIENILICIYVICMYILGELYPYIVKEKSRDPWIGEKTQSQSTNGISGWQG